MFGVDLRFSSAFFCIGFAAYFSESWNRDFFACFFNLFTFFFALFFANLPFPSRTSGKAGKIQENCKTQKCEKHAKQMQQKLQTNAKQAKKTLKLETKTLFLHVFSDISLFF